MTIQIILGCLKILLFNILLSIDNINIIAISIKDFPKETAKKVALISLCFSAILKILLSSISINILMVDWLPIRLIGGIILVMITWNLLRSQNHSDTPLVTGILPSQKKFLKAIGITILADMSMSLENIVAISISSDGNIYLIAIATLLTIPILILGSYKIIRLMQKFNIILYLGISAMAYTAVAMILEDQLIIDYIPDLISQGISITIASSIILYGFYRIKRIPSKATTSNIE